MCNITSRKSTLRAIPFARCGTWSSYLRAGQNSCRCSGWPAGPQPCPISGVYRTGRRRSARGLCLSRTWLSEIPGRPEAVAQPAKMVDVDHPVLDPQGRGVVRNRRTPTPVHGEAARRAPYGHLLSEIAVGLSARFSAPGGRDRSETHTLHPGHMGREAARRRGPMSPGGLVQESPC